MVGHVRITAIHDDSAVVRPCVFSGMPAPQNLPVANSCAPVFIDFGDVPRLTVGLDSECRNVSELHGWEHDYLPKDIEKLWQESLKALFRDGIPMAEWTDNRAEAQIVVQLDSPKAKRIFLVNGTSPRHRGLEVILSGPPVLFGPLPATRVAELTEIIGRIAGAQNLLAVTQRLETEQTMRDGGLDVDLKIIRFRNDDDQTGTVEWRERAISLVPGELVAFRVDNPRQVPLDVTLLRVKRDFTITPFFTNTGDHPPWKSVTTPRVRLEKNTNDYLAEEHMVLIAVPRKGPLADFSALAEPSLDLARKAAMANGAGRAVDSPLGNLLLNAMYATGKTQGLDVATIQESAIRKLSWQTVPALLFKNNDR